VVIDVVHFNGFSDARRLVNIPGKSPNIRGANDTPKIALNMHAKARLMTKMFANTNNF
jgi:hypothetical protein